MIANLGYRGAGNKNTRLKGAEHEPKSTQRLTKNLLGNWQTRQVILRQKLVPIALVAAGLFAAVAFESEEIFVPANGNYSVAAIALEEHWIKGAAPILAANFDQVSIRNLNKDVEDSFVFDIALSQIYEIDTDYSEPPLDVRDIDLGPALEPYVKEQSEVFCNNEDLKYCELILAWDETADSGKFIALRLTDSQYGIVEVELARSLGVRVD